MNDFDTIRFFHYTDNRAITFIPKQMTIAYSIADDGKSVDYGIAYCSRHDQYNKKMGKAIAYRTLKTKPKTMTLDDFLNGPVVQSSAMHGRNLLSVTNFKTLGMDFFNIPTSTVARQLALTKKN